MYQITEILLYPFADDRNNVEITFKGAADIQVLVDDYTKPIRRGLSVDRINKVDVRGDHALIDLTIYSGWCPQLIVLIDKIR